MPQPLPSCWYDIQVAMKPPSLSAAIAGAIWSLNVLELICVSVPTAWPLASYRCAYTPKPLPSCPDDSHATTKPPSESAVTVGESWLPAVVVFTCVSTPTAAPDAP